MTKRAQTPAKPTLFHTTKSAAFADIKRRLRKMKEDNRGILTIRVTEGDEVEVPFLFREAFGPSSVVLEDAWRDRSVFDKNCTSAKPMAMLIMESDVFAGDTQDGFLGYYNAGTLPPIVIVLKCDDEERVEVPAEWSNRRFRNLVTENKVSWPTLLQRDVCDWNALFQQAIPGTTLDRGVLEHLASCRRGVKEDRRSFTVKELMKLANDAKTLASKGLRHPAEFVQKIHLLTAWTFPTGTDAEVREHRKRKEQVEAGSQTAAA